MFHVIVSMCPHGTLDMPPDTVMKLGQLQTADGKSERIIAWTELCTAMNRVIPEFEKVFIFKVLFPRLDEEVTIKLHHQITAPFVVHPDTKRCSVPIPDIDTWIPSMAPRLSQLVDPPEDPKNPVPHWKRDTRDAEQQTILVPYVKHLRSMLNAAFPFKLDDRVDILRRSHKLY